ncbi:hypothetical protein [Sanguibacter suaedae]|uniref:Preprotein translocase subunit SecB n=1 Tax=Sanguibacter suaedae TaxID=2795737 RepID=A0A934I9D0_9MICO|nr:hypothetical protein [Sanguibacter suaedae]MBI9113625.1 hypothetical protein [Sanguibacter suaedae]
MLPVVELTEIKVYEITGRRIDDPDAAVEPEQSLDVQARGSENWFETRVKLSVDTSEAQLLADVGAVFTFSEPLKVPQVAAGEFVEKVGVMAVYPFLREHIFTTAGRLGVAPPVLGLLRAGTFTIASDQQDSDR